MATADNERFTRCFWEVQHLGVTSNYRVSSGQWFLYAKGGRYQKWSGLLWLVVDWEYNGQRVMSRINPSTGKMYARDNAPGFFFKTGITYTVAARGSMGARKLSNAIFGHKANLLVFYNDELGYTALLSTHVVSYILRVTTQSIDFSNQYVANLPIPSNIAVQPLRVIETLCVKIKQYLTSNDMTEYNFNHLSDTLVVPLQTILHSLEGLNEKIVSSIYQLEDDDIKTIIEETGTPAGWYPLITYYDNLPQLSDDFGLPSLPQKLFNYLAEHERINPNLQELTRIKANMRAL